MSLSQDEIIETLLSVPKRSKLAAWSKQYAASTHLAGDHAHACSIKSLWESYGIPSTLDVHRVLQNKPIEGSRVALINPAISGPERVLHAAQLVEDVLPEDPASATGYPAFHGYSHPGAVTAPIVYANFGHPDDFKFLKDSGIEVKGHIALIRYGRIFRGLKVKAAQEAGAVGAIIYSDPQEDGPFSIKNGHKPYPKGPARHPSAIQRGSVSFFSFNVGDPHPEDRPYIPSMPISYRDAHYLFQALEGHGFGGDELPLTWKGDLPKTTYNTGPSKLHVELVNAVEYSHSPIYNVIGKVQGQSPSGEFVVLANHHDSWCSGAVDPVSGSASMNELLRGFQLLLKKGWKPWRTLVIASWDMEEYGLVGSTGWAKRYSDLIKEKCVAYLNVDESTTGGQILKAVGSPLLTGPLYKAAKLVKSPLAQKDVSETDAEDWVLVSPSGDDDASKASETPTIYSDWLSNTQRTSPEAKVPQIGIMGTGADYTAFQHHLGIPCLDMVFAAQNVTTFQYHTKYDSFAWMSCMADRGFRKHKALTQLWGALAVIVADEKVLGYRAEWYTKFLEDNFTELKSKVPKAISLDGLYSAIKDFGKAATKFDRKADALTVLTQDNHASNDQLHGLTTDLNQRYRDLEKSFLLPYTIPSTIPSSLTTDSTPNGNTTNKNARIISGLPGRPFYKHVIFAPGLWLGYTGVAFPGILDAMSEGREEKSEDEWLEGVQEWVDITTGVLKRGIEVIKG